ncbi:MAG: hypothetical protein ACOZNI_20780 [Myxococcota bacterium]
MASVSVQEIEPGKWRLRWREFPVVDGVRREKTRSYTVGDQRTAEKIKVQIRDALDLQGTWDPPVVVVRSPCNLEAKSVDWLVAKRARGLEDSTIGTATSAITGFFAGVRTVRKIAPDAAIPGTVLSRKLFTDLLNHWRDTEMSEGRRYDITRYAADFWGWLSDEDEADRVGVEPAPRDLKSILPRKPTRGDPPPAPTIAEMDATLREAGRRRSPELKDVLTVLRFTGLREGQGMAIRVKDVELQPEPRLWVDTGKSRAEKRGRWVPISPHLAAVFARLVTGKAPEDLIFACGNRKDRTIPSSTMKALLEACEERGEIRADVWRPKSRDNFRTTHMYRAGLQAFWERPPRGKRPISRKAIDALVGHAHAGETVRDLHYSPAIWEEMRRAVGMVPEVDGKGAATKASAAS